MHNIQGINIITIRYADDAAIVTRNKIEIEKALENLQIFVKKYGIKINAKMVFNKRVNKDCNFKIEAKKLEEVESLRYLGNLITNDGRSKQELKIRIAQAKEAFWN
jgi:hypothetical protein